MRGGASDNGNAPSTADAGLVSIVLPTYRECENVPLLVPCIDAAMRTAHTEYEVIVVDDDSRDGIDGAVADLCRQGYSVTLVVRTGRRGLATAVIDGFRRARGARLVCMDADLSHPPERLPALLAALDAPGADFVIGSRYVAGGGTDDGWTAYRWLNSGVATLLARPFTRAHDPMAGYFALRRSTFLRAAPLDPVGYKIALELIVKCRCHGVREVPIRFAKRHHGQSKLSLRQQILYLKHLLRLARFRLRDRRGGRGCNP